METSKTFIIVYLAILITFAVVIHTVEAAIPVPIPVPGTKLGLANIITLLTLALYGFNAALTVAIIRSVLGSLFIGNFLGFGFILSITGAIISCLVMNLSFILFKREKITLVSVSILGSVTHNMTQLAMASILVQSPTLFRGYLPFLILLALPTGFFTGLAANYLIDVTNRVLKNIKVRC